MMDEEQIRAFLEDIKSVYMVGYFKDDLTTEAEKWGQIQVLEWILSANAGDDTSIFLSLISKNKQEFCGYCENYRSEWK